MKGFTSNYYKTHDGEQIYYSANFLDLPGEHENVLAFNYGLVCSMQHWSKQLGHYHDKGYKILIHDYRGHYLSSGDDILDNINFRNMANDLKDLCLELKIKNSIQIGHSMGVNVCLEFARRFPEMTKKLILISGTPIPVYNIMFNTNLSDQLSPLAKKALENFPKILETIWKTGGKNPLIKKIIHKGGFNTKTVPDEFVEIYLNRLGQLGPQLFFQLMEQMNDHDILSFIQRITMPALVIGGDQDKVIPNYLQKLLAKELPDARLYIVKDGSHVPQVDFPELINERIDLFLERGT